MRGSFLCESCSRASLRHSGRYLGHSEAVGGHTRRKDVATKEKGDRMQSFFLAETLKYF